MKFDTLISVAGLEKYLNEPDWVVVDCRFGLEDTDKGYKDYLVSHIPGALYAHLDDDLSGTVIPGKTGRHPLPDIQEITSLFGSWGINDKSQVVVYDDRGGMIAARLWWLLKWLGHDAVAVLDGGFLAWIAADQKVSNEIPQPTPTTFIPKPNDDLLATAEDILENFGDPGHKLIDSRAPERFRGEIEPLDPVAGRIPGAVNYYWTRNLDSRGHFEVRDILRGRFESLISDLRPDNVTFYCGSGVTAAHNVLVMAHTGLGMAKLYSGSWSHWITESERPILTGE